MTTWGDARDAINQVLDQARAFCQQVQNAEPGVAEVAGKIVPILIGLRYVSTPSKATIILLAKIAAVAAAGASGGVLVHLVHERFGREDPNDLEPAERGLRRNIEELRSFLKEIKENLGPMLEQLINVLDGKGSARALELRLKNIQRKMETFQDMYDLIVKQMEELEKVVERRAAKYRRWRNLMIGVGVAGGLLIGAFFAFGLALPFAIIGGAALGASLLGAVLLQKPSKSQAGSLFSMRQDVEMQYRMFQGQRNIFQDHQSEFTQHMNQNHGDTSEELTPERVKEQFERMEALITETRDKVEEEGRRI